MAFVAEKIIGEAVRTASPTFSPLVRFFPGLDFFCAFLNETILFPLIGQFPVSSFNPARLAVTISPRGLLGWNVEGTTANFTFSYDHL